MFGGKKFDEDDELKLKRALSKGDFLAFKRLVKGGVDVNSKYWFNSTLLHEAVQIGNPELVEFLLQNNANIHSENDDKRTALHLASRGGLTGTVQVLLKYGANVNAQTTGQQTPVYIASWRGKADVVKLLVEAGADVNIQEKDGWLPLHWAMKHNKADLVEYLVMNDSYIDIPAGKTKVPPFIAALKARKFQIAQILLTHGARCTLREKADATIKVASESNILNYQVAFNLIKCGTVSSECQIIRIADKIGRENVRKSLLQNCCDLDQSLLGICRAAVRSHLTLCCQGKSIYRSIQELTLPRLLKDYLLYEGDSKVSFESVELT